MPQKDAADENTGNLFFKTVGKLLTGFLEIINPAVGLFINEFAKQTGIIDQTRFEKGLDDYVKAGFISKETAKTLGATIPENPFIRTIFYLILRVQIIMSEMQQDIQIFSLDRQYKKIAVAQPTPAPVDNLVRGMILDPARSKENRAELKKYGYNDFAIDNIILSYYKIYGEEQVRTCYLRGIITEERMYERMRELGYTDQRTKEIIQTWQLLPGAGDLFTMVAHEAFEPDAIELMGLDDEFPAEQTKWLLQQGLSEYWQHKYWEAHWQQPSIGQGYEMLHRGVIGLPELDMLYRTVEIPKYWRDKLTAIAYQPYTRVDVRRMHDLGVLNDQQLIKSFLDLGYDAEHALNMANFTIKYNSSHTLELTRGAILDSYRSGLIDRSDAMKLLKDQDFSDQVADYYLTLEDFKLQKQVQEMQIDNLKDKFLLNLITESQVRNELNKMSLLGSKIDALIEDWSLSKYKYQRLPTKSDADNWLIKGLIQSREYSDILEQLGYPFRYRQLYLKEIGYDLSAENEEPVKTETVINTKLGFEQGAEGRPPTKADIDKFYKAKLIDLGQYKAMLHGIGYSNTLIELYAKSI